MTGFLLISKPPNLSSAQVVAYIKRRVGRRRKVGHTGTLDPFATGLLILAVGRQATRHCGDFLVLDKKYRATAQLGELTDTLDCTGALIEQKKVPCSFEQLAAACKRLGSTYEQTPPIYSALKAGGKPLYKLARKGVLSQEILTQLVELKKRYVKLHTLTLEKVTAHSFTVHAHVSHGTYIRSLLHDIAQQADTWATTHELIRLKIGPWHLENAHTLCQLKYPESIEAALIDEQTMLTALASHQVP